MFVVLVLAAAAAGCSSAPEANPKNATPEAKPKASTSEVKTKGQTDSGELTISIAAGGMVLANGQRIGTVSSSGKDFSRNDELRRMIERFVSEQKGETVVVKADHSLKYGDVLVVVDAVRNVEGVVVNVEASTDAKNPYATPPPPMGSVELSPRPDPYVLVVAVDPSGALRLLPSGESVKDAAALKSKLTSILEERAHMATPKKTVTVRGSLNLNFGQVVKVVDAIKGAGAEPVILQVDALE
jgi:biopolymer transport protein ExbD